MNTPVPSAAPLPPLAPGFPIVGNLPAVSRLGMLRFLEREWRRHGDVFRAKIGRDMVVVVHPDAVERVLASNRENYVKGRTYDVMRELTGDGLLTLEGAAWKRRRRLEQPSFHKESIRRLVTAMVDVTRRAIAQWRVQHPRGGTLEAHHEMMRLTLDVVGETLFGQRLAADDMDASGDAFAEALAMVSVRGNSPLSLPLAVPTPANLKFRRATALLDRQVFAIIAKARQQPDRSERPTLLNMLLDAKDADTGHQLTDGELRDEVITLFLAGHETTALALTWGFTLLRNQPEVLARMRAEVDAVLGGREPTAEDVPRLVYVKQVVDEILRLRTPTWAVARDVVQDDVLSGHRVRAGETVLPVAHLTHRHPAFWPDPLRFDPDRFAPEQVRSRSNWAYYPFSLGPRMCIGNVFSLVESQIVLAMLVQQLDFEFTPTREVEPIATVTMRPSGPVPVRIRWRS